MSVPAYWRERARRYRLEAAKCTRCGKIFFPPRLICDECRNREFETVNLSREGKLVTYTIIHVAPPKFTGQVPYAVGIVETAEGARLLCQVVDVEHSQLKVGMSVRIEFRRVSEEGDAGIIQYGYKAVPA